MQDSRYLIVWDRIGDYHRARIRAFEKLVGKEAVYTADLGGADNLYGWKASAEDNHHFILSSRPVDKLDLWNRVRSFRRIVREKNITHLAVAGYAHPEYVFLLLLGRAAGLRIVMFAESWYGTDGLKSRIKGFFLKRLVDCFFVSGKRAREHFHKCLGMPNEIIIEKYSVVDNQHFSTPAETSRENVILCVARFSPEKNLSRLITAFQKSTLSGTHSLRIIGGGPERPRLESLIGTSDQVELVDWAGYDELPGEYARARYFILPSTFEPWGLVVNEAMASGLPVVVSSACGCAPDLVTHQNGLTFNERNESELIKVLDSLAHLDGDKWNEMSEASKGIIAGYDCGDWAEQLKKGFSIDEDH